MKSKKQKGNPTSPRSSEEDLSTHRNAFSFLKTRFFTGNHHNPQQLQQHERTSSPCPSTASTHSKNWSIDNSKTEEKPLTGSFDEHSISEFNTSSSSSSTTNTPRLAIKNARPLSMMGMDSILNQQNSGDTIKATEPTTNAFIPACGSSTAASDCSHKRNMNKLSLDLANDSVNLDFVNNSTAEKRTSMIILKEGYLFKKTDFKPFHKQNRLDRGWKLYRVILRGHKIYLYKVTSESPLRSLFPGHQHHHQQLKQLCSGNSLSSRQSLTFSLSSSSIASSNTLNSPPVSMKMIKSDFDSEAQLAFFTQNSTAQGVIFMELNQVSLRPVKQVYLIMMNKSLYICTRPQLPPSLWKIDQSVLISQLKLEYMETAMPTSPISINSMQSDSYSNGPLLFSILHDSSILGVYSTQFYELGQSWINAFVNSSRMCDDTQNCQSGIIYDDDRSVQGGTIYALIRELLLHDDPVYLNVFLLTYTLFTTGSRVLMELKTWALEQDANLPRLFTIFTIWCKQFSLDVVGDVATGMMEILELVSAEEETSNVKELVLKTVNENVEKTCEQKSHHQVMTEIQISDEEEEELNDDSIENISAYNVDGKRRDSINLSNLLITGLTPAVFLLIDPRSFAQQIYLFHFTKQKQFYQELLNPLSYLPRPQLSAQMLNSLLFTTAAPHFLTKIIRNQILIDSQQNALMIRSKLLEHWIRVGLELLDLGDMTGWCAVAMGVCAVGVIRLRETWKAVRRDLVRCVQEDWVCTLTDYGLFTQDMWAEEWTETPIQVLQPKHHISMEGLPFFGTVRQFADRYRKHSKRHLGPTIINFEECTCLYKAITSSIAVFEKKEFGDSYIDAVGPLQSFFEHSVMDMMSVPHDYKYLQECSLACEPRIFGQGRRNKPQQTEIETPSSACLSFPTVLDSLLLFQSDNNSKAIAKPLQNNKMRRRTYSFPQSYSITEDLIEAMNSETWFMSTRQHTHTSLIEMKHNASRDTNGDILLTVQQEELVYKASAILFDEKTPLKKTESMHSIDFLNKDEDMKSDALAVSIKAGYLEQLVDSLVYGVSPHEVTLKEQWDAYTMSNDIQHEPCPEKVVMDEEEYILVFFMTCRTFCSPASLLDMLRRRFLDARYKCRHTMERKNSLTLLENYFIPESEESVSYETCDWKKLAQTQLRVMNLILYWVETYPYDFMDEVYVTRYMSNFLKIAKASIASWQMLLQPDDKEALELSKVIEKRIVQVRDQFIRKSVCPCYDMKTTKFDPENARSVENMYERLTSGAQQYLPSLQQTTNQTLPMSIVDYPYDVDSISLVDTCAPEVLLEQVDLNVRQLFHAVTMQDWIQTLEVLGLQTQDIYAWLPARKPSRTSKIPHALAPVIDGPSSSVTDHHLLPDEVVISDVFFAVQNARRSVVAPSAFSDDDLILAFPGSIQSLYLMHFIIRSWVINEIAAIGVDSKMRVLRIEKFLQIVLLSKTSSERFTLFPELKGQHESRVPGFVEYAIASALVSPEVRLFTKAWHDVAMQHGHAQLNCLEDLLNQIQQMDYHIRSTNQKLSNSTSFESMSSQLQQCQYLVPSLGWFFEQIIELSIHVPDTFDNKEGLINMDKQRCVYHLLQLMMNVQADLDEQQKKKANMSFLLWPRQQRTTWKELRETSIRESKKAMGSSLGLRGASSNKSARQPIFNKLVSEQTEKLKRELKERDRIDKDWLSLQQRLQKKQLEQAKITEKQDKKQQQKTLSNHNLSSFQQSYNVMPRINSFFRGLRPPSTLTAPIQHFFPFDQPQTQSQLSMSLMKASTVINLIHSTTSVASTYTKRDFVFRIVTEEGAQYLLQAMSREDMNDWMQQINTTAREGAAKRQSVLANETVDTELAMMDRSENRRMSVYGVGLDELMPQGQVPNIAEICIREIEKRGLEEVGIYRVAGTGSVVSALKAAFNKDVNKVDLSDPEWADINVVADAFKQFLRELPEPLLTYVYYDELITASASEDHDQRVYLLKEVLSKLPFSNYILLKRIIEHFVIVTDFEATNHMYATNLAIVFGPTLLQPTPGPTSFATTMSNLGHHQNIVKYLILNYHYLFDVECDEVEPSKENESQQ